MLRAAAFMMFSRLIHAFIYNRPLTLSCASELLGSSHRLVVILKLTLLLTITLQIEFLLMSRN